MRPIIVLAGVMCAVTTLPSVLQAKSKAKDPVLMTVNGREVKSSEFTYFYDKNKGIDSAEVRSFDDFFDLFVAYKLKVAEAYEQGVDTTLGYKDELAGYRKKIAEPYLSIEGWPDSLVREVKERRQYEVNAKHILLSCGENTPQPIVDSLYMVMQGLQQEIKAGTSFDSLASKYSNDPTAPYNHGDLGYFSTMQMVYPFENAVYNTPVGEDTIMRTNYGWHLIQVVDRRKTLGEVHASHIMQICRGANDNGKGTAEAKAKIDSAYAALQAGQPWDEVCARYSNDQYSAHKAGDYGWINHTARFPMEWIDSCYRLQPGQYSMPFATDFGWHIVRVTEVRDFPELTSEEETQLRPQLLKDPDRMAENRLHFIRNTRAALAKDKRLAKEAAHWTDDEVYNWADAQLEVDNDDFKHLYQEYHDGLMLFDVSQKNVWERATRDSLGLADYFAQHREKYSFPSLRFKGAFIECADDDALYSALKAAYDNYSPKEAAEVVRTTILTDKTLTPFPKQPRFHIVTGLFKPGDNAYVDEKMFYMDSVKFTPRKSMPRVMLYGDLLSAPEEYSDVRGAVVSDYQDALEKEWVDELRKKYEVKVDEKQLSKLRKQ